MADTLTVFNIQRYSLHDGEGIRTVFFLKGCPLTCRWCCNPESQNPKLEVMFRKQLCIGCKNCGLCQQALRQSKEAEMIVDEQDIVTPDFSRPSQLLKLSEICPSDAFHKVGEERDIEELLEIAEADALFYGDHGGITLSGGEPLMQEGAVSFLKKAKEEHYLSTAIETCGAVPTERLLRAAKYLDQIFIDLKSVDSKKHLEYTGSDGVLIRKNLKKLFQAYPHDQITVRTPVIPGFNDKERELRAIEEFLSPYPNVTWQKLNYHEYGVGKYEMLGREYTLLT